MSSCEDVQGPRHSPLPATRCPMQGFVHRLLDRGRTKLRSRGAEGLFVEVDQVLGHPTSIYATVHVYVATGGAGARPLGRTLTQMADG